VVLFGISLGQVISSVKIYNNELSEPEHTIYLDKPTSAKLGKRGGFG
jgi:hypothetical protein